jgi:hypothetical protein
VCGVCTRMCEHVCAFVCVSGARGWTQHLTCRCFFLGKSAARASHHPLNDPRHPAWWHGSRLCDAEPAAACGTHNCACLYPERPAPPSQGGWRNMACARLSAELTLEKYSPITAIPRIEVRGCRLRGAPRSPPSAPAWCVLRGDQAPSVDLSTAHGACVALGPPARNDGVPP